MTRYLWLNLPVKDVERSKQFYKALGFPPSPQGDSPVSTGFMVGQQNVVIMLFTEEMFATFTRTALTDTSKGCELLISIDAESRDEVDLLTRTAREAGGSIFAEPEEKDGWMYGSGFADPDGTAGTFCIWICRKYREDNYRIAVIE